MAVIIPSKFSASLIDSEVVLIVGKSSQKWANRGVPPGSGVFSVNLLDKNFTDIDLASSANETGIKIILPSENTSGASSLEPRLGELPVDITFSPRSVARFHVTRGQTGVELVDRFYLTIEIRSNVTNINSTGLISLALMDGADLPLEKQVILYSDLRSGGKIVRWNFPDSFEAKFLSVANEGNLDAEMTVEMFGTSCSEVKGTRSDPADCLTDASPAAQNMRMCICSRLSSFGGRTFGIKDFLMLERTVVS